MLVEYFSMETSLSGVPSRMLILGYLAQFQAKEVDIHVPSTETVVGVYV